LGNRPVEFAMSGRTGRDLLLCIIRVMECGWGLEVVINPSKKMIDYMAELSFYHYF